MIRKRRDLATWTPTWIGSSGVRYGRYYGSSGHSGGDRRGQPRGRFDLVRGGPRGCCYDVLVSCQEDRRPGAHDSQVVLASGSRPGGACRMGGSLPGLAENPWGRSSRGSTLPVARVGFPCLRAPRWAVPVSSMLRCPLRRLSLSSRIWAQLQERKWRRA